MPSLGCLVPPASTDLATTYKYPHASLHYKQRVWSSVERCPIHFQALQASLSFLAQLQLQSSSLVVQQSKSGASLIVQKSLLGLVQLFCNSFISALLYLVFISVLYSSIACFTLCTLSLVFVISELMCLLFGISSIGYLIISSLSLVLVSPSGQGVLISFQ